MRKTSAVRALLAAVAASAVLAPAASAQAGGPFACLTATVFVAQGGDTQLNALAYGTGASTFEPIGPPSGVAYNSIGFSPTDSFIYGMRTDGVLVRIDDSGTLHPVGQSGLGATNIAAFDDAGNYYVTASNRTQLFDLDTSTGAVQNVIQLTDATRVADLTFIDGFLWGQEAGTPNLVRVNPATGDVSRFAQNVVPANVLAGAAWTYGNGNLGLSDNNTGTIYQVKIADGASATPSFSLVAASDGPASGNNDGTSCPGQPADLRIAKTGPSPAFVGQDVTWTLTVTNDGPGISSGYAVSDTVPASYTNVASPTPGCSVNGNAVTCSHGPQGVGESATFTITATAASAADGENTATVVGNDRDPDPSNDSVTVAAKTVELVGLCRGTPVAVLGLMPGTANGAETPCRTDDRWIARIYQGNVLNTVSLVGTEVWGRTTAAPKSAAGRADVATANLTAPGVSVQANGLHSEARSDVGATCDDISTTGSSDVATLVVNGRTYTVRDQPMVIPAGLATVYVNRQDVQGTTITQRALFVDLPGTTLDVTVAESRAGMTCGAIPVP